MVTAALFDFDLDLGLELSLAVVFSFSFSISATTSVAKLVLGSTLFRRVPDVLLPDVLLTLWRFFKPVDTSPTNSVTPALAVLFLPPLASTALSGASVDPE